MAYLGLDLGTSSVKAVLTDDAGAVLDQESAPLAVSRLHPLWSEQDPESWWTAANAALIVLGKRRSSEFAGVHALGLSGQMHGATLLDGQGRVLRPAILWNDGRSGAECAELEARAPRLRQITGNIAMPGFTAPKLLWVARHESDVFRRTAKVLLPKDYLRFRMTGVFVSDMSDASGTLWMDVGGRRWSEEALAACDLKVSAMPELVEGSAPGGRLAPEVASAWGLPKNVVVAGGAGDNAAGAVGVGVLRSGEALLSLGTSGVFFVASDRYAPRPESAVHTFCHCLPATWHRMSVILSAASCLDWVAHLTGTADVAALLAEAETAPLRWETPVFLPYLSGERTPHNDPNAKGVFFGMTHTTGRADLGRAVLEGVAFAFADGQAALTAGATAIREVSVIGGGTQSAFWGGILAAALNRPLVYRAGGETGPAYGAARLARLAHTGENPATVCTAPEVVRVAEPDPKAAELYRNKVELYRELYRNLRGLFAESTFRQGVES